MRACFSSLSARWMRAMNRDAPNASRRPIWIHTCNACGRPVCSFLFCAWKRCAYKTYKQESKSQVVGAAGGITTCLLHIRFACAHVLIQLMVIFGMACILHRRVHFVLKMRGRWIILLSVMFRNYWFFVGYVWLHIFMRWSVISCICMNSAQMMDVTACELSQFLITATNSCRGSRRNRFSRPRSVGSGRSMIYAPD